MKRQSLFTISLFAVTFVLSSFAIASLEEYGKAGYYADSFHGRKTASGEVYNKFDLTCSHKSLPFGTRIRVTRIDNKKSVIVRVNDRGPSIDGFVVDLSRKAAETIDLIKEGVTRVRVDVVETAAEAKAAAETESKSKVLAAREDAKQIVKGQAASNVSKPAAYNSDPTPASGKGKDGAVSAELYQVEMNKPEKSGYAVQISTLFDANNVLPTLKKLQAEFPGKALVYVIRDETSNTAVYKVLVGPYGDKKAAEGQQKQVAKKGYKKTIVVDLEAI